MKRYDMVIYDDGAEMEAFDDGRFVRYDDAMAEMGSLQAEINRLNKALESANQKIGSLEYEIGSLEVESFGMIFND